MTDIVERLRSYASDDHERLCQGREYSCSCGYDDKRDPLLTEAAAEIERLRAALREYLGADDQLAKVMPERVSEGVIAAAIERVRAAKREARAALAAGDSI